MQDIGPSPTRPQVQEPVEPPDPLGWFDSAPSSYDANDPSWNQSKEDWFDGFARKFKDQNFQDLGSYIDYANNVTDANGNKLMYDPIKPFIQKEALRYMPKHIQDEYNSRRQEKEEVRKTLTQAKTLKRIRAELTDMDLDMDLYGRLYPKNTDVDFQKKEKWRMMP